MLRTRRGFSPSAAAVWGTASTTSRPSTAASRTARTVAGAPTAVRWSHATATDTGRPRRGGRARGSARQAVDQGLLTAGRDPARDLDGRPHDVGGPGHVREGRAARGQGRLPGAHAPRGVVARGVVRVSEPRR